MQKGSKMPPDLRKKYGDFLNKVFKLWQAFWEPPTGTEVEDEWWSTFMDYINDLWVDQHQESKPGGMEATMMLYAIVAGAESRSGLPRSTPEPEHWKRINALFRERMGVPLPEDKLTE